MRSQNRPPPFEEREVRSEERGARSENSLAILRLSPFPLPDSARSLPAAAGIRNRSRCALPTTLPPRATVTARGPRRSHAGGYLLAKCPVRLST